MNIIPDELILCIAIKLYNEDIMNLSLVSKRLNALLTKETFKEFIKFRKHPIVFNSFDRLCDLCNFSPILWDDGKIKCIHCKHE
jgi:hypothetical protein